MLTVRSLGRLFGAAAIVIATMEIHAASMATAADFFSGKTVKLIVGMPPAGGVDTYARVLQRHIVRHLPGNPTIVAQNMPGAGSLRSIQAMAVAPDDATTIVTVSSTLLTNSFLAPKRVKVDFRDFKFIGNVSEDTRVCYVRKGFTASLAEMMKEKEVIFGVTTASQPEASMLKNLMGIKMKLVGGYAGSADKRLALEKGEVDGDCGGWTSLPLTWRRDGTVRVFIRLSPGLLPGMDKSIPYGADLLKDADERRIFEFLTASSRLGRLFMVKKQAPADQVAVLRQAFDKTMADKAFRAEADKLGLSVTPTSGAEVDRQIEEMYATPPALIERARQLTSG
jgi:tripartite-type tricarboxylate transporter receptor subunit TctC